MKPFRLCDACREASAAWQKHRAQLRRESGEERGGRPRVDASAVRRALRAVERGASVESAAKASNISTTTVRRALNGRR